MGKKLSLSMRDVDQKMGNDLIPMRKNLEDESLRANPLRGNGNTDGSMRRTGLSGITIVEEDEHVPSRRPLKRMSSPEKWEAKQLIVATVLDVRDYPNFDERMAMECCIKKKELRSLWSSLMKTILLFCKCRVGFGSSVDFHL